MMVGENAMPSASEGRICGLIAVPEHVRTADTQRVDQQEPGDHRALEAGGQATGERQQLESHAEQQNGRTAPRGTRGAEAARSRRRPRSLLARPAHIKQEQPARDAERPGDQHRQQRELDRGRKR